MAQTLRAVLLLATCLVVPIGASATQSWTVAAIATDAWLPSTITLQLSGSNLLLNNTLIWQPGGSSAWNRRIRLSGVWGACGTVDANGSLVADPYATFVILANETPPPSLPDWNDPLPAWVDTWYCLGYVQWAPDTPEGYTAPLVLGADFAGNGASAYHYEDDWVTSDAVGTSALQDTYGYGHGCYGVVQYYALSHTFSATHAPEPSSMLALLAGVGGLAAVRRRTRRG
jgi:hypothetical protein